MSASMLDQAIIDAEALKEAAIKNAETALIEKYSKDIKEAVNNLLEQDEFEEEPLEDPAADEESDFADQVPSAATDGEELCPCPDEEEEVEIDFDELARQIDSAELDSGELEDREEFADELEDEELELQESVLMNIIEGDEDLGLSEEDIKELSEIMLDEDEDSPLEEETQELEEEEEQSLEEKTKKNSPDRNPGDTPDDRLKPLEEEQADIDERTKTSDTATAKEPGRRVKDVNTGQLVSEDETSELKENNEHLKSVVFQMKEKLGEVNLSNAKLLYTNKILLSDSLNERQKNKIVEAISKAQSIEESKTIFETLQSAVGSVSNNSTPKSLNEVVSKRSTTFLPRKEVKRIDPAIERMQKLAGLNKNS